MLKEFPTVKFDEWKKNLSPDQDLPVITTSALIKLSELEQLIAKIKPMGATGVSINLVRFTWNKDEPQGKKKGADAQTLKGCQWSFISSNGKTQVAIAISPTKNFKVSPDFVTTADDIKNNGQILLLIPDGEKEGPTGHNPPSKTTGKGG